MNCPNCGAANEPGARFCAECGTPLESQVSQPAVPPPPEADNDQTIMSSYSSLMAEQAKTVSVSQADVAAAAEGGGAKVYDAPEPEAGGPGTPPPPSMTGGGGGSSGGGGGGRNWMTQRNIIIAVVVLVLLCCCCAALGVGANFALQNGDFDLGMVPVYLALV